jgi:WD40 repeat protein
MLKQQVTFTQHQQLVRTVVWSPDGTMLASGGDDAQLFIWGTNGAVMHNMQHDAAVRAFAWAPDGQRFVTGAGTEVAFFDIRTGENLARSTHRHNQMVMSLAWAAHGDMAVVSGGADHRAIVWDTMNYGAMTTFTLHTSGIEVVSWAADGQTVASSSQGGAIRVWNGASGQELHNYFQDANAPMRALAFAPTGTQLVVGGDDGIIRMWNGTTCQMPGNGDGAHCMDVPQRMQASLKAIRSLAWSPNGRFLAVGADDGMLLIWDVAQNRKLLTSQQNGSVHSITWSPDGKQLASAAGNIVTTWALA